MDPSHLVRAWQRILVGRRPALSIEITRECPLRCPGCYAYDEAHLGGLITLRQLSDRKGDPLVRGVLELVDRHRPIHVSLVGGDPLVRYRELEAILPELASRGIHVQLVTSAFRPIPVAWSSLPRMWISVSVDGLAPEHDVRRAPATYERILKNIAGGRITIHCTITGPMMKRDGYLEEFVAFWSAREEVRSIWMSIFTPQRGSDPPECLTGHERARVVDELLWLRGRYPKLDMGELVIREFRKPPSSPAQCLFARTTETISADLRTRIEPCQFGGDPDCSRCGCMASMGLAAVGNYRVAGLVSLGALFRVSEKIGSAVNRITH